MKTIPITKGQVALVDDEDYEKVSRWRWCAVDTDTKHGTQWYAQRHFRDKSRRDEYGRARSAVILMHRAILGVPKGRHVDHINGDGLDNRRANLRVCTAQQNLWNQRWAARPDKPYKGVRRDGTKRHPGWIAVVTRDRRRIRLGWFKSAEAAARAYDAMAALLFGEFACLNFPAQEPSPTVI